MAGSATTLWVPPDLRDRLARRKRHPRQPYHEVISQVLDALDRADRPVPGRLDPLVARNRDRLLAAAEANGIARLWLFGSRARGDARLDSDIDLLFEAQPGKTLWDVCAFTLDAEEILGVSVDFVERAALKGEFRDRVAREAVPL
ncbi:MAG TPA: nucleotidyltransferase family protein [Candidatus Thermoplasmatota archaeon]|nr:nucleotidyltransferase family protein [Candidatus Thermoplasmatota archaeon]